MTLLEWLAQGLVILLLGLAIPIAWRLQRALATVRAERHALAAGAEGLAEATVGNAAARSGPESRQPRNPMAATPWIASAIRSD